MAGESQAVPSSGPDPTVLTTEQLLREAETVRRWVEAQLAIRDQRIDSIDKATVVFNETLTSVPTDLQAHEQQIVHLKDLLDERYTAQQAATTTAFSSAQREVQAALASAEKAVAKAEVAADKRFEAVNEFRAQLSDQATRFYTRVEAEAAHHAISDKVDADETRTLTRFKDMSNLIGVLSSRLDLAQGITVGATTTRVETRLDRSSVLALYGFVLSIFLAAFAVVTYLIAR